MSKKPFNSTLSISFPFGKHPNTHIEILTKLRDIWSTYGSNIEHLDLLNKTWEAVEKSTWSGTSIQPNLHVLSLFTAAFPIQLKWVLSLLTFYIKVQMTIIGLNIWIKTRKDNLDLTSSHRSRRTLHLPLISCFTQDAVRLNILMNGVLQKCWTHWKYSFNGFFGIFKWYALLYSAMALISDVI